MENFMKEQVSLISLLSTIFTVAVGRILTNSHLCKPSCSRMPAAPEIQITFGPNGFLAAPPAARMSATACQAFNLAAVVNKDLLED
jgi:hypothetical protein